MDPPGADRHCAAYMPTTDLIVGRLFGQEHQAVIVGERPGESWNGDPAKLLVSRSFLRLAYMIFDGHRFPVNDYLLTFERVNIVQHPAVGLNEKVVAAAGMAIHCLANGRPVVLCGRVAERALGFRRGVLPRREGQFVLIPHPNRLSTDPVVREKTSQLVRDVLGLQTCVKSTESR